MSAPLWVCLVLLVLLAVSTHARPKWSSGTEEQGSLEEPPDPFEERINLHHSLKEIHHSVSKVVKDIHSYIHQQLGSAAKKQLDTVSRPLIRVMAPVVYLTDRLINVNLHGSRKPSQEEEIYAWCPTCLETGRPTPEADLKLPCFRDDPTCLVSDSSPSKTELPNFNQETTSLTSLLTSTESSRLSENQKSSGIPEFPKSVTGPDTFFVSDPKTPNSVSSIEKDQSSRSLLSEFNSGVDIRFWGSKPPIRSLGSMSQLQYDTQLVNDKDAMTQVKADQVEYPTTECALCLLGLPHHGHVDKSPVSTLLV